MTNTCCSCLADKGNGEKRYHCQSERTPVGRDFNVPLTLEEYDTCDKERATGLIREGMETLSIDLVGCSIWAIGRDEGHLQERHVGRER